MQPLLQIYSSFDNRGRTTVENKKIIPKHLIFDAFVSDYRYNSIEYIEYSPFLSPPCWTVRRFSCSNAGNNDDYIMQHVDVDISDRKLFLLAQLWTFVLEVRFERFELCE